MNIYIYIERESLMHLHILTHSGALPAKSQTSHSTPAGGDAEGRGGRGGLAGPVCICIGPQYIHKYMFICIYTYLYMYISICI